MVTQKDLGVTVRDKINGFHGIVTGYVYYISGCNQALVSPPVSADGKIQEGQWLDVQRLEIDASVEQIVLDNDATPGFDAEPPKR
jgi:hypothetical protein